MNIVVEIVIIASPSTPRMSIFDLFNLSWLYSPKSSLYALTPTVFKVGLNHNFLGGLGTA